MSALIDLRVLIGLPLLGALGVSLAPGRWSRALGGGAAGLALVVALSMMTVDPAGLAIRAPWIAGLGLWWSLGLDELGMAGVLVVCLIGQVAALAPGGSRGSVAGGLGLQAVVLATLLARDLGLLVACYGLLAPLAAALVMGGARPERVRAALAVGLYLSLGTALLAVAAGGLAVAHHDASGGLWSLELAALAELLLPARAEAVVGGLLALAGALTLGLWPLHGWLLAGIGAARPGTALLLAGALRWVGIDLLLRLWLPLTPAAAAAQAPAIAWAAVIGGCYGALVARAEPDRRRAVGLAALVPAGLLVLGLAGQHHEGALGAVMLAVALCLGGAAGLLAEMEAEGRAGARAGLVRRLGRLGLLPAPGLIGLVGTALVLIGSVRFAELTLGGHATPLAVMGGLAVAGAVRALADRTGRKGHVVKDSLDVGLGGLLRPAALLVPVVAAGLWPGRVMAPVERAARGLIEAATRDRCERVTRTIDGPVRAPAEPSEACAQPLRALELANGGAQ